MNQQNNLNISNKKLLINLIIKKVMPLLFSIIIAFTIVTNVLMVQENEIVLIKGFGKTDRIIDKPGMYFKVPIIQTTTIITKNLTLMNTKPLKLLTKDNKNIVIENLIVWKVNDARLFLTTIQNTISAELKIDNSVYSTVSTNSSKYSFTQIMTDHNNENSFDNYIILNLNKELNNYGINIVDFKVKNVYTPEENEDAIYDRMKSERAKIASQYISAGEKSATEIKAEADKNAKILLSKAYSYAEELKGKADAEAAKLYAESYNQDPDFYKFIRTLESYKKVFKGKPTIVLPIQSSYAKYLLGQ